MKFFNGKVKTITNCDKEIIKYIENNTNIFIKQKIVETAKACFVSAPMITKFAKKYGYSGYRDMQIDISIKNSKYPISKGIGDQITTKDIANNISSYMSYGIDNTINQLNHQDIFAAILLINSARHIFTFGEGTSSYASINIANKMKMLGKRCHKINTLHDIKLWGDYSQRKKTILIMFSHSAKTKSIKEMISFAKRNDIFILLVTASSEINSDNQMLIISIKTMEDNDPNALKWYSPKISLLLISDILVESAIHHMQGIKKITKFKD